MPEPSGPRNKLLAMLDGYRIVQVLYVAAQLGIADLLRDRPQHTADLARAVGAPERSLHRLLRALASLDVIREEQDGRFALTATGTFLRSDVPESLRAAVIYYGGRRHWTAWGQLLDSVKSGKPIYPPSRDAFAAMAARDPAGALAFNEAMAALSGPVNESISDVYDFSDIATLVDVGGGYGALLIAVLTAYPGMRGILLEIPPLIDAARARMEAQGLSGRCDLVAGNAFEAVPDGADGYVLKWVLHDWDDEACLAILTSCRRAMRGDSRLLVVERILPEHTEATPDARNKFLSDLNMMLLSGGGERTEAEYRALLESAGFHLRRIVPTATPHSIIEALPAS